jgi:hypothetical protein
MKSNHLLFPILSLATFFILNSSFSQISKLDEKFGFKSIKLGSEKLDIPEKKLLGGNLYTYSGEDSDLKYAFNVKFDFLIFNFSGIDNTLSGIQLSSAYTEGRLEKGDYKGLEKYLQDYEDLLVEYVKVLGQPNHTKEGDTYKTIYYWIGDKVALELKNGVKEVKLNDDGTPYFIFEISITINSYDKDIKSTGF